MIICMIRLILRLHAQVELGLGSPLSHRQLESTEELYDVVHDRADVLKAP